tara:strand:+ start:259 stop:1284 length:1026 start_codon:yes stop_codon:yes gene_type:complete
MVEKRKKPKRKVKKTQKQKQKQTQRQSIVVNINTKEKRKKRKPRANANANTNRVLSQFAQPLVTLPSNLINPPPIPNPSMLNPNPLQPPNFTGNITREAPIEREQRANAVYTENQEERLRRFQQEEQSLSGFSIPQAQDSLRNYPPPPSIISSIPTSARVGDFDDLRNYPTPDYLRSDYSRVTPTTMSITGGEPSISSISSTPSRIGLGNPAFDEYTRPKRGRPPTQLMRTYSEPRRYEGAGSSSGSSSLATGGSSGVSSVSSTSIGSQLDRERPELARARASVTALGDIPITEQNIDQMLQAGQLVQQDIQTQMGGLAPAPKKTRIKVRRQGSVQSDPNY